MVYFHYEDIREGIKQTHKRNEQKRRSYVNQKKNICILNTALPGHCDWTWDDRNRQGSRV